MSKATEPKKQAPAPNELSPITVRLPNHVKDWLLAEARKNQRSLDGHIRFLLINHKASLTT